MVPGPLHVQQHLRQIRYIFGNVRVMKLKMLGMDLVLNSLGEMRPVVNQMDSQLCHLVKVLEQDGDGQQTKPFPNKEATLWTPNRVVAWESIVVPAEKTIVDDAEVEHPLSVQADDYQSDAMEEEFELCGGIFGENSGAFQDCEENKMMYRAKPSATSSNNERPCVLDTGIGHSQRQGRRPSWCCASSLCLCKDECPYNDTPPSEVPSSTPERISNTGAKRAHCFVPTPESRRRHANVDSVIPWHSKKQMSLRAFGVNSCTKMIPCHQRHFN